jgi:hypothetical protein
MDLSQHKDAVLLKVDPSWTSLSSSETAINNALSSNAGHCLAGVVDSGDVYYVLADEWGVANPVHSVVLVEITTTLETQLPTALSANPGYSLVEVREFSTNVSPAWAFVLGTS